MGVSDSYPPDGDRTWREEGQGGSERPYRRRFPRGPGGRPFPVPCPGGAQVCPRERADARQDEGGEEGEGRSLSPSLSAEEEGNGCGAGLKIPVHKHTGAEATQDSSASEVPHNKPGNHRSLEHTKQGMEKNKRVHKISYGDQRHLKSMQGTQE